MTKYTHFRQYITSVFSRLNLPQDYFLVFLAAILGLTVSTIAFLFLESLTWLGNISLAVLNYYQSSVIVVLWPALGGLMCGLVIWLFSKESKGHGVPEVINAVLVRGGYIPMKTAISKLIAAVLCIGSLNSAGQQGPIVLAGSSLGSYLGRVLRLGEHSVKILVGCGAAAGIAATFNAPIGGVIFAIEVIVNSFSPSTFTPIIMSSVIASVFFHRIAGDYHLLTFRHGYIESASSLFMAILIGAVCGVLSAAFILFWSHTDSFFERLNIPQTVKPALGGLAMGLILLVSTDLGGSGYHLIKSLSNGTLDVTLTVLVLLFVLKFLGTSLVLGSGGSGGMFAPSLVMGAICGTICYQVGSQYLQVLDLTTCLVLGMAAFVAGTTHGTIAAVLILCEMTSGFGLILPLLLACIASIVASRMITDYSIYTVKLKSAGIFLKNGHDLDVLKTFKVSDVQLSTPVVDVSDTVQFALSVMSKDSYGYVAVCDQGNFIGVLSYSDLVPFILGYNLDCLVGECGEIRASKFFLKMDQKIVTAYKCFCEDVVEWLPVFKDDDSFMGLLYKRDLVRNYTNRLNKKKLN
jgi:CIC family chloride channel protein